ncbi:DgyrCDS11869 [Dimorphilus gyrociliatus]|uniref:Beta-hexosaminidase n=1 Tax=Dimorphilus gyrociliatus TaxID=2664684 RepID=A0A7I8W4R1_9ANNE|nr:DgyrCDS11869 [Dimorphilus gyrociliatus]
MHRCLTVLLIVAFFESHLSVEAVNAPPGQTLGQPWPMPQSYQSYPDLLLLNSATFNLSPVGHSCDILQDAIRRYRLIIFGPSNALKFRPKSNVNVLANLDVNLMNECEKYPSLEMKENYTLTVTSSTANLASPTIWGILRGLETFSQLVYRGNYGEFLLNATKIVDFPRFSHRGVLLDTSRHYLSKEVIKENIEAMAYNKMNVFHWHIVDDQSFPYQSRKYPKLSDEGAYNRFTHIYTQNDVAEIIEFARVRGIRVIPEYDTPGHSQSWGKGQKGLLTECYSQGKPNGNFGPINPIVNTTYTFLEGFFSEVQQVFPDKYTHMGGDEVSFDCWKSNPDITKFMQQHGFPGNYSRLEQYYEQRLLNIMAKLNAGYIIWQEVVDNGVKVRPDTVVHVWKGGWQQDIAKVTALGHRALLSTCWYLDYISYGTDWTSYYNCEPLNWQGSAAQKKLVMGGEAALWGEFVDTSNVVSRLWPRASAVAEKLWSSSAMSDATSATPRFKEHRCRMVGRGIRAEPQNGPGYCVKEFN